MNTLTSHNSVQETPHFYLEEAAFPTRHDLQVLIEESIIKSHVLGLLSSTTQLTSCIVSGRSAKDVDYGADVYQARPECIWKVLKSIL